MLLLKTFITSLSALIITSLLVSPSKAQNDKVILIDPDASCITSECHASMGKKKYIHAVGIDPSKCRRCHIIQTAGKHIFKPIAAETGPICAQCHDKNTTPPADLTGNPPIVMSTGKESTLHKPFAEGKCTACHDAHESNYFRNLKDPFPSEPYATYTADTYRLCYNNECHKDFDSILETPRLLSGTLFRNGNLNLHFKHVNKKKGRTCYTCHRRHGATNQKLIANLFQFGTRTLTLEYTRTDTGGTCVTPCHQTGRYDRYEPIFNAIRSSPTPGTDATKEELDASRQRDPEGQASGDTEKSE